MNEDIILRRWLNVTCSLQAKWNWNTQVFIGTVMYKIKYDKRNKTGQLKRISENIALVL